MSFDKLFDLTAGVYLMFIIYDKLMSSFRNRRICPLKGFLVSAHRLVSITLLTLVQATLYFQRESPTYILDEDTQPAIRAI